MTATPEQLVAARADGASLFTLADLVHRSGGTSVADALSDAGLLEKVPGSRVLLVPVQAAQELRS